VKIFDLHTHGVNGSDTGCARTETILEMARIQGSLGVNGILPAVYPGPVDLMRSQMDAVRQAMEVQGNQKGHEGSAKILGLYLEGPFLNQGYCGALDPTSFLFPSEENLARTIDGFSDIIRIMVVAPELPAAGNIIRKISDLGITVSMGHSSATYREAEEAFSSGARGVTHLFNAMRPFHHREPGLAGFGLTNPHVFVEVIADPYHLHRAVIDLVFRVKRPERIIIVSDTVGKTSAPGGSGPIIADGEGEALLGGSMTVREAADRLITFGYPEEIVMRCIANNPAAYLFLDP